MQRNIALAGKTQSDYPTPTKGHTMTSTQHTTYYRYTIVPICDDDMQTVIGYDVMAPGSNPIDDEPVAEMVADIDQAKAAVREDRADAKFRRMFGLD